MQHHNANNTDVETLRTQQRTRADEYARILLDILNTQRATLVHTILAGATVELIHTRTAKALEQEQRSDG